MSVIRYNYKATDDDSNYRADNINVSYDRKIVIDREVTNAQGAISIDLSGVGTMKAIMVITDNPVKINLATDSFTVGNVFFADSAFSIATIENEDSENDANVTIIAWGTA
jgi:hypothetical protein